MQLVLVMESYTHVCLVKCLSGWMETKWLRLEKRKNGRKKIHAWMITCTNNLVYAKQLLKRKTISRTLSHCCFHDDDERNEVEVEQHSQHKVSANFSHSLTGLERAVTSPTATDQLKPLTHSQLLEKFSCSCFGREREKRERGSETAKWRQEALSLT